MQETIYNIFICDTITDTNLSIINILFVRNATCIHQHIHSHRLIKYFSIDKRVIYTISYKLISNNFESVHSNINQTSFNDKIHIFQLFFNVEYIQTFDAMHKLEPKIKISKFPLPQSRISYHNRTIEFALIL